MPSRPSALTEFVHRAGRDALDVGLLNYCGQRLLGHAPGLEETWEIGASPQLGDPGSDGSGPGLPVALAIAVALDDPGPRCARPKQRRIRPQGLQRHQPFGRQRRSYRAETSRRMTLLQQRPKRDLVVGHRGGPRVRIACRSSTLPGTAAVATVWISRPPTPDFRRSLRRATYPQLLHYSVGHDPRPLLDQLRTLLDASLTRITERAVLPRRPLESWTPEGTVAISLTRAARDDEQRRRARNAYASAGPEELPVLRSLSHTQRRSRRRFFGHASAHGLNADAYASMP